MDKERGGIFDASVPMMVLKENIGLYLNNGCGCVSGTFEMLVLVYL